LVHLALRLEVLRFNNLFFSMNSVRWLHIESFHRRSLAPVR
jgi:hypothetical protein